MFDDRQSCICGHHEDKHELTGYCADPACVCEGFLLDDEERVKATESMLDNLRGK